MAKASCIETFFINKSLEHIKGSDKRHVSTTAYKSFAIQPADNHFANKIVWLI